MKIVPGNTVTVTLPKNTNCIKLVCRYLEYLLHQPDLFIRITGSPDLAVKIHGMPHLCRGFFGSHSGTYAGGVIEPGLPGRSENRIASEGEVISGVSNYRLSNAAAETLAAGTDCYVLRCRPDADAARICYGGIFG